MVLMELFRIISVAPTPDAERQMLRCYSGSLFIISIHPSVILFISLPLLQNPIPSSHPALLFFFSFFFFLPRQFQISIVVERPDGREIAKPVELRVMVGDANDNRPTFPQAQYHTVVKELAARGNKEYFGN